MQSGSTKGETQAVNASFNWKFDAIGAGVGRAANKFIGAGAGSGVARATILFVFQGRKAPSNSASSPPLVSDADGNELLSLPYRCRKTLLILR